MAALALGLGVGVAVWLSAGELTVASGTAGSRIGILPSLGWLALPIAALCGAAALRTNVRYARISALSLVAALPWLPLHVPAATFVWTGHARAWLWIGIVVALLAPARRRMMPMPMRRAAANPRVAPWLAASLALCAYLLAAWLVSPRLPGSDEPHYLVITQSLLADRDLKIENNHRQRDYRAYFGGVLKPDYLRRGQNGEIYSVHPPGLPTLIAPAFALFGYPGVVVFMVILAALGTALAWIATWRATADAAAAWFGWAAVSLSVPFLFHSFVVYPDAPGAVAVMFGVLTMMAGREASGRSLFATGIALAALPWLHTRFAVLAAVLGVLVAVRNIGAQPFARRLALLLSPPAISAAAWLWFFFTIYGTANPAAPYGSYTQTSLANLPRGLVGILFDQQFGLLPNAPVYACAACGFVLMMRRHRRLTLELLVVVVPYGLAAVTYEMWWAGTSSPARFLVAILLPAAIPAGVWFSAAGRGGRILGLGSLVVSLLITATLAVVDRGQLLYNVRQEEAARWLKWISPVVNVATGVPSLFRSSPSVALMHAAVWVIGCAATAWVAVRLGRSHVDTETVALGAGAAAAASMMLALSIVWRSNHAQPLTPEAGSLALLRQYDRGRLAIRYEPFHVLAMTDVPPLLTLDGRSAGVPAAGQPLLVLPHAPAGMYEIDAAVSNAGAMRLVATSDQELGDQWTWDLAGIVGPWRQTFELPVAVERLVVDADPSTRRSLSGVSIRALRITAARDRISDQESVHAARYGPTTVFQLDRDAYLERTGAWIGGGGDASFLFVADPRTRIRLLVRNGPRQNKVTLASGAWREAITLQPGEERSSDIPLEPGHSSALLRVTSSAAWRPSDVDPSSDDRRLLGCWIETR
ncbi:MAG TPA: hypothetical protein VGJ29_05280 [Vicinamibacterales bacterium]